MNQNKCFQSFFATHNDCGIKTTACFMMKTQISVLLAGPTNRINHNINTLLLILSIGTDRFRNLMHRKSDKSISIRQKGRQFNFTPN